MNPAYTPLQESLIQLLRAHQLGALHLVPRLIKQIEREWKREGQLCIYRKGIAKAIDQKSGLTWVERTNPGLASDRLQARELPSTNNGHTKANPAPADKAGSGAVEL